jgi:hypothetical protein
MASHALLDINVLKVKLLNVMNVNNRNLLFMAESILQSAYRYTGEFRGEYTGNSRYYWRAPVCHL